MQKEDNLKQNTVGYTVESGLCCGCGVCKAICPTGCIAWEKRQGFFSPHIDEERCVHCGSCAAVCPGLTHKYETRETALETVTGTVMNSYNAWTKDPQLRHVSASGGVVSTLIRELLMSGSYDGVFCLDTYDYREQLKTQFYTIGEIKADDMLSRLPKSRYLPVSHENAVTYMKEHRDARLILIGSSCAVRGLLAAVDRLKLDRAQYLLIGLFCDKVFNYNVLPYFEDTYAAGKSLLSLHFKNKESGGWPGDMKFFPQGGTPFYVPLSERSKAKDYFSLERCLYCVDKLNVCADISVGDNYTGKDSSELGSNSVIIRTPAGKKAWVMARDQMEVRDVSIADIQKGQALEWRLNNLQFGDAKMSKENVDLNQGVPRNHAGGFAKEEWKIQLNKLQSGACYDTDPEKVKEERRKSSKQPNLVERDVKRIARWIKRKLT